MSKIVWQGKIDNTVWNKRAESLVEKYKGKILYYHFHGILFAKVKILEAVENGEILVKFIERPEWSDSFNDLEVSGSNFKAYSFRFNSLGEELKVGSKNRVFVLSLFTKKESLICCESDIVKYRQLKSEAIEDATKRKFYSKIINSLIRHKNSIKKET